MAAQSKKKKAKLTESPIASPLNEQKVPSSPSSPLQPTTSKLIPEKVTDVQFKFKKGGELTMTSQSSLERSPMDWGTVQFLSDEQTLPQSDKPDSSVAEKEPTLESAPDLLAHIKTETSTKSTESSETGGEGDLDAYRDQTGRLRRKKPRKQLSSSTKSDDIPSTIEQEPPSEEDKIDSNSISKHWADALATPLSNTDEEQTNASEFIQEEPSFEDEDTSETSSKLDAFLPAYILQQIKTTTPRSLSLNDDRSKSSSTELSESISQLRSTYTLPPSISNRSTSTDTSENESRKHLQEYYEQDSYSTESSNIPSTTNLTGSDTLNSSPSFLPTGTTRKKKQRPKMLKKDLEAKTLLTHEFDDTPLTITEIHQAPPVTQLSEDAAKQDESFFSSLRQQISAAVSNLSDSLTSTLSTFKTTTTDEQTTLQTDEPVPSIEAPRTISPTTSSESTTKKSSTRSPRKRSKRDSGPDYDNLALQPSGDIEQSFTDKKVTSITSSSIDDNQPDLVKVETHKHQLRQRTSSGRQVSNTEEENEQQAILADDEADEDATSKPVGSHGISSSSLTRQSSSESSSEKQDISSPTIPKEDVQSTVQVSDELKTEQADITSDQQTISNEQLRPVQGFHSFTPNKYQYNQYEEGPTNSTEQVKSSTTEPDNTDAILARGLNLWLQQDKETDSSPSLKKERQSTGGSSGLTRAMQSLIIQPIESDNDDDDEEEEDSWNGPRARKPTYTTGIPIEKQVHTNYGYNINHPRTTITTTPSWLISPSVDKTSPDDSSKFDPDDGDEDENSMDDTSDQQPLPHAINTQLSTTEERQAHLNTLADLTFQSTINNLSSSSSSISSTAKWNESSIRSDDTNPQQTSFTEDDVQRCLGEDFYRESLAADTLPTEQRTITSLDQLVLKPSQSPDDLDDDEFTDNQRNHNTNNNNNQPSNFDEWAHFLERKNHQEMFVPSLKTSSPIEKDLSSSPECSYARALDDDTLVSDANRSNIIDYVQQSYEIERQRYGDFSSLDDDDSPVPESTTNPIQHVSTRSKPSETFQRWRNQSNRDDHNLSTQTSLENQNDDEIIISHSDGGLSRRVRPSS
jgi:hypothetical protein